ncbi:MAG: glycosyltransferase family 2 protein [Proteobacteria bacterium]|nr:glycosyltransferase family 2 protein [Pseudomonadota bacterium]
MAGSDAIVGVVVPMYNARQTIAATLASICRQTHHPLDIVVVDDGSTDESAAIVAAWAARDNRVRLVRQDNAGVAAARNTGAAATAAPYLAFVDADDLWAPDKVASQLALLEATGPEVGLVYCWFASIREDDRVTSFGPQALEEGDVLHSLLAANWIGTGSSLMLRRAAFEAVGGYDSALRAAGAQGAEDIQLCFRVAERAEFRVVPRYLVGYRFMPNGMSRGALRMFRSLEIALDEMRGRHPDCRGRIAGHLQDASYWFAWRALAGGQVRDFFILAGEAIARRPLAAPMRLASMALETIAGRVRRRLGIGLPSLPLYTEAIW